VGADALLLMCNAATHDIAFGLPAPPQGSRRNLAIDTSGVMLPECSPRGRRLVDNSRAHRVQDHFSAILLQGNRHAEDREQLARAICNLNLIFNLFHQGPDST
jgi:hypothetical protein